MKKVSKIVHELEFGVYHQEWELSFEYDNESTEEIKLIAHNYRDDKFMYSTDITSYVMAGMLDAMLESIDLEEERNSEAEAKFDDMFSNEQDAKDRVEEIEQNN